MLYLDLGAYFDQVFTNTFIEFEKRLKVIINNSIFQWFPYTLSMIIPLQNNDIRINNYI